MMKKSGILALVVLIATLLPVTTTDARQRAGADGWHVSAALPAPQLRSPATGTALPNLGPVTLDWDNPGGTKQFQIRVGPFKDDGPGLNLIIGAAAQVEASLFTLQPPKLGLGPYVMLPGMTYTWQVRVTDATTSVSESDSSWGPWSEAWSFKTPAPSSSTLSLASPADNALVSTPTADLQWQDSNSGMFYYEVQVSGDSRFDTNPATATTFVWWNLVHGGVPTPLNSWRTPPLAPDTTYYWRVRPRVQGDGTPVDWGPTWRFRTPRPSKIVFNRFCSIWTMNADGSGQTQVSPNDQFCNKQPAWSPDGARIAFVSNGIGADLWVMNADGSGLAPLLPADSSIIDEFPDWSPDGTKIAFTSNRNPGAGSDIFVVNADGSGLRQVTTLGSDTNHPAWSPDGAKIAFDSNYDGTVIHVRVINADGSGLVNLTSSGPEAEGWPRADYKTRPAWSPDGTRIVFLAASQIWVMNADGSGKVRLVGSPASESPTWSGDGTKIVFVSIGPGYKAIHVINADGTGVARLTASNQPESEPDWTP